MRPMQEPCCKLEGQGHNWNLIFMHGLQFKSVNSLPITISCMADFQTYLAKLFVARKDYVNSLKRQVRSTHTNFVKIMKPGFCHVHVRELTAK